MARWENGAGLAKGQSASEQTGRTKGASPSLADESASTGRRKRKGGGFQAKRAWPRWAWRSPSRRPHDRWEGLGRRGWPLL